MEVKSFELEEHPDQLGRNKLIEVTEKLWPELWHGLRAWINQGATEPLRDWAARQGRGIKDDWFVEVLDNTARFWRSDPQSDAAQLKPGSRWSRVPPATIGPMFVIPRFSRPYPDFMETPAGFKKRMRAQFNYELDLYTESRRKSHAFNTNPKYETHLKWTCLALKGLSAIEIASSPSDSNKEYRDLEQAVSRAIKLTARRIGLVLSLRS
jgi:hypothetical protein